MFVLLLIRSVYFSVPALYFLLDMCCCPLLSPLYHSLISCATVTIQLFVVLYVIDNCLALCTVLHMRIIFTSFLSLQETFSSLVINPSSLVMAIASLLRGGGEVELEVEGRREVNGFQN